MAKRILIYTNHFYPEQFKINEIVKWLSDEGHEIKVITGLPNYPNGIIFKKDSYDPKYYNENVTIIRLPLIPRGSGKMILLFFNYLSYFISCIVYTVYISIFNKPYDIIFVHHTSPILIAIHPILYSVFNKKSKKFLWDLDLWPESLESTGFIKSKIFFNLIKSCVKLIYKGYDKILIGSRSFERIIRKRYKKKIIYFPNWAEKEIENNIINTDLNLEYDTNKFIIMYTGNIGQSQSLSRLVLTIDLLKNNNLLWVFIGGGRNKKLFIDKLNSKRLLRFCKFVDHSSIDKIPSHVHYADALFISLADKKIFNNTVPAKLQAYMSMGKPIIGVLGGEGANLILESNCGIVQSNFNYSSLASQILNLKNKSKEERIKMGLNGKDYYEKKFKSSLRKVQLINIFN